MDGGAFGFSKSSRSSKKRRKTRTAFTNQQIFQLEKRFIHQKYLTPTDRDEIAQTLRLSNAQVITWFQNRRAKLKRDLEELKADVTAAKALGTEPSSSVLNRLEELMHANEHGLKRKDSKSSNVERKSEHTRVSSTSAAACLPAATAVNVQTVHSVSVARVRRCSGAEDTDRTNDCNNYSSSRRS